MSKLLAEINSLQEELSDIQFELEELAAATSKNPVKTMKLEAKIVQTDHLDDVLTKNKENIALIEALKQTIADKDVKSLQPIKMVSSYAAIHSKISTPLDSMKKQFDQLCEIMRNIIETAGYLQNYLMELQKYSEKHLIKIYAQLSKQHPETESLKKLSKQALIEKIKEHIDPMMNQLLQETKILQVHYIEIRQKLDPKYKQTIEIGDQIKKDLGKISHLLISLSKLCYKNNSEHSRLIYTFNKVLQNILLTNTLNQSKFNNILEKSVNIIDQLRLALLQEFKDENLRSRIELYLSDIKSILTGDLSDNLLSFRKTLLSSVASSAVEFCLPIVAGALNALVPLPLPIHAHNVLENMVVSKNTEITAASSLVDKSVAKSTEQKLSHINELNQEWKKLWYVEMLKQADLPKKIMTYGAALGVGALLTAVGAPHIAALLIPAGISASSTIVPKAIQQFNTTAEEQKVFQQSISALSSIQEKIKNTHMVESKDPIQKIIKNFLQLDEKQMLEFEIEANKIKNTENYFDDKGTTSLETINRMESLQNIINSPHVSEMWSLLKIYQNAVQLEKETDPILKKNLQKELNENIKMAVKHYKKHIAEYDPYHGDKFAKVLSQCQEIASDSKKPSQKLRI